MKRYTIIATVDLPDFYGIEGEIETMLGDIQFEKFRGNIPDNAEIEVDIEGID